MIRSATLFCSKAFNILLESLPPSKSVPLSKLSQYIPDDLLESVCVEHGSLKNFISSAPNLFQLNSVGIKNTLMVSRAMKVDALDKAYISNVVDEHDSKRPVEKKLFPDSPKELLLKISELLENTPQKLGVSALYGLLNSSERRTTRKCGGILTILRANTDLFTVSKLGMYVALRSKQISVLDDVNELECSDVEPEESMRVKDEEPKVRNIQPRLLNDTTTNEKVQHHAMFLVKFLPLHWTIEPNLLDTVPADVRAEHMSASPHRIIQRLMDFLEVKSSQGSKHRILRLKRGMYIPDVGLIRSDSEMRRLEVSHVFFNTYVTQFGGLRVDFDKLRGRISLPQHLEMLEKKEMLNLLRYRLYCDSCIHLPRFSAGPKSLPIKFQILKLTVPKYYTPIRALEHLLSSDYEKGLGGKSVVEWLKSNKDIFEVTIPYVKSKTVKSELCVRRRNISYCQISEDDTADECRSACPADNSSISFSTLLENLPERYVDAIPLENVEHYIISILKEKLHVTIDSSGIIWFKRRQKNESEI